ncbi:Cyclic nucleotide phosphodiesterase [Pelomyxa schiedti]|nr:Cyclic nucleotide phosphodiesterase [Pelomyxa schiedti]
MFLFIDENADTVEVDLQKRYLYDHITIMPNSSQIAGSGVDQTNDRTLESFVRRSALAAVPVNRSAPCECNPYWLMFLEKYYTDELLGVPCESYCSTSKMLALGRHFGGIYIPVSVSIDEALRMWGISNGDSITTTVYPWKLWRSLGTTIGDYIKQPDYQPPFWPMFTQEANPTNKIMWTDPYYNALELMIQVGKQIYGKNNTFIGASGITLSMQKTTALMTSVVSTPGGFAMLVSDSGYVISSDLWAFPLLFGSSFNFSARTIPSLTQAQANFTALINDLKVYGYNEILFNGTMWLFAHHPLELLPWTVVVAVPSSEILSGVMFTVNPTTVQLSSSGSVVFTISLNNTGVIPVYVTFENPSLILPSNFSEDILLQGGESVTLTFHFDGDLPYSNRLWFQVRDAVTAFSLCFNSRYSVLVSITADSMVLIASISVGGAVAFLFFVTIVVLLLVIRHFKRQVAVLSQPLTSAQLFKTPAEAAIKKLTAIMNKKSKLEADDKLSIEKIIQLIATNGLHRVDYIAQKKACLANFDSEVNAYLMEQLISPQMKPEDSEEDLKALLYAGDNASIEPVITSSVDEWDFSAFEYSPDQILGKIVPPIFQRHGLFAKFNIEESTLMSWLDGVTRGYLSNPYHNVIHAADVLQACHVMLLNLVNHELLSPVAVLSVLFSAIIHDLAHPGVNNNFLYRILDPLALTYNGISILENMHVHEAFELTLHGGSNWLSFFSPDEFLDFHKQVTSLVLTTDMSKHVELLSFFKTRQSVDGFNLSNKSDTNSVLQMILKMSDICNQTRAWSTASRWTTLVVEECFQQGDQEEKYNLPKSPFMDRDAPHIAKCQCTFIQFVVSPLLESVSKVIDPRLSAAMKSNLSSNLTHWQSQQSQAPTPSHSRPHSPPSSSSAHNALAAATPTHTNPGSSRTTHSHSTTPTHTRGTVTPAAAATSPATSARAGAVPMALQANAHNAASAATLLPESAVAASGVSGRIGTGTGTHKNNNSSGGVLSRGASYLTSGSGKH